MNQVLYNRKMDEQDVEQDQTNYIVIRFSLLFAEKSEEDQQRGLTPIEETVEEAIIGSKTNPKTDNTNVSQVKKRRSQRGTAAERMMSKKIRGNVFSSVTHDVRFYFITFKNCHKYKYVYS